MTRKETILSILYKAKEDYEASIKADSRKLLPNGDYKRLNTEVGLCEYFQRTFNVCNIVDKHLIKYKPNSVLTGYWFPIKTREGFEKRLAIINNAIEYYNSVDETDVPFILIGDYFDHVHSFIAYERGFRGDEETDAINAYMIENYDDIMEGSEPL